MFDLCVCSDTNGSIRLPDPTQPCKIIIFSIHLVYFPFALTTRRFLSNSSVRPINDRRVLDINENAKALCSNAGVCICCCFVYVELPFARFSYTLYR